MTYERPESAPGGMIHTYRRYDPQTFPMPASAPPDLVTPAFDYMMAYGSLDDLTPEQLAEAIEIEVFRGHRQVDTRIGDQQRDRLIGPDLIGQRRHGGLVGDIAGRGDNAARTAGFGRECGKILAVARGGVDGPALVAQGARQPPTKLSTFRNLTGSCLKNSDMATATMWRSTIFSFVMCSRGGWMVPAITLSTGSS